MTETDVLNRPLRELSLDHLYNASITRIRRSGVEFTARGSSRLHYGDVVHVVGDRESLERVTDVLGNSVRSLNETQFMPVFLGIAVGVLIGMIPLSIPGVPFPVRLGLAGGPLIAAIAFSLIGNIGRVVWYIPYAANLSLREFGIILFLACAGLKAGDSFFRSGDDVSRRILDVDWDRRHDAAATDNGARREAVWQAQLPDPVRSDRGQHDRSAGTRFCKYDHGFGILFSRLCSRLPTDHDFADHCRSSDHLLACLRKKLVHSTGQREARTSSCGFSSRTSHSQGGQKSRRFRDRSSCMKVENALRKQPPAQHSKCHRMFWIRIFYARFLYGRLKLSGSQEHGGRLLEVCIFSNLL